jgi:hypothetical protein
MCLCIKITFGFVQYLYHTSFPGDKIEKNEMGQTCRAYGGEERPIQGFGGET